jgi:hypothetical protein
MIDQLEKTWTYRSQHHLDHLEAGVVRLSSMKMLDTLESASCRPDTQHIRLCAKYLDRA